MPQTESVALAQHLGISPLMLKAVRTQIAPAECPDEVIALYFTRCKAIGADPFARQLYIAHRRQRLNDEWTNRWMIETTIDGLRSIAETTGEYDGQDAPIYEYDNNGNVISATVTVYRKGINRGITATAFHSEYVVLINGAPNFMWSKMPHNQTAKCAEALAFRKAFPRQLNGIYTDVELEQSSELVNVTPAATASNDDAKETTPPAKPQHHQGKKGEASMSDAQRDLIARRVSNGRTYKLDELTDEEKKIVTELIAEVTATTRQSAIEDPLQLNKREASKVLDQLTRRKTATPAAA